MIDLILTLDELVSTIVKYIVYRTEYGSDYRAIKTIFNIVVFKYTMEQKRLFKNVL